MLFAVRCVFFSFLKWQKEPLLIWIRIFPVDRVCTSLKMTASNLKSIVFLKTLNLSSFDVKLHSEPKIKNQLPPSESCPGRPLACWIWTWVTIEGWPHNPDQQVWGGSSRVSSLQMIREGEKQTEEMHLSLVIKVLRPLYLAVPHLTTWGQRELLSWEDSCWWYPAHNCEPTTVNYAGHRRAPLSEYNCVLRQHGLQITRLVLLVDLFFFVFEFPTATLLFAKSSRTTVCLNVCKNDWCQHLSVLTPGTYT